MLHILLQEVTGHIHNLATEAVSAFAEGDELRMLLLGVKRFTKSEPFNAKDARRRIAARLIEEGRYCF
jgi:hypothetical protein